MISVGTPIVFSALSLIRETTICWFLVAGITLFRFMIVGIGVPFMLSGDHIFVVTPLLLGKME